MPVVQQLTLLRSVGDIPEGTQIMVVTRTKSDRSTDGILPALRKAGYTDDQFLSAHPDDLTDVSNWKYSVMPEEDPGELNLTLAKFSQPIYTTTTFHGRNAVRTRTNVITDGDSGPILSGAYWDFWKRALGSFFWLFLMILFPLWIIFVILKFFCKFAIWIFINILNLCTFGILDLDTDWDDLFD